MVINGKGEGLTIKYRVNKNKNENNSNKLNIILEGINTVTNLSYMFNRCSSLLSLPDISKWSTNKVINMSDMFNGCKSLTSLPDISKWNTDSSNEKLKLFNNNKAIKNNNKNKKEDLGNEINNTNFNIFYLIDTTLSMKKYENFIYLLQKINNTLVKIFLDMKIGYVLYKDFKIYNKDYYNEKIKVFLPSKSNINLPKDLEFLGGYDYSEDWAYSYNKISEITKDNEENIVIHICDSNAHGSRFSDYDNKDEYEKILIEALKLC